MDEYGERLPGFNTIYSFEKHIDDWDEDYSCQIRIFSNARLSQVVSDGAVFLAKIQKN